MKVKFWGVRGSIPAPGPETNRYGGNTSCVSVETAGGLIIIDMGTGLMHLGNALLAGEFGKGRGRAGILLSHTHWDHIQGLGFFAPVFIAGNQFTVWGPGDSPKTLEEPARPETPLAMKYAGPKLRKGILKGAVRDLASGARQNCAGHGYRNRSPVGGHMRRQRGI